MLTLSFNLVTVGVGVVVEGVASGGLSGADLLGANVVVDGVASGGLSGADLLGANVVADGVASGGLSGADLLGVDVACWLQQDRPRLFGAAPASLGDDRRSAASVDNAAVVADTGSWVDFRDPPRSACRRACWRSVMTVNLSVAMRVWACDIKKAEQARMVGRKRDGVSLKGSWSKQEKRVLRVELK